MKSYWKFWCNANNEKNAVNLLQKVKQLIELEVSEVHVETDQENGYVVSFTLNHALDQWNDYVVETIRLAQNVGYGWVLSGDITSQVDGWSNECRISGIQSMQWICDDQLNS